MSTTLTLKSSLAQISRGANTNDLRGSAKDWRSYALSPFASTGAGASLTATSVSGPIAGLEFIATGSILAEWITDPLAAAVTISSQISFNFCGSESNAMANGSASFLVQRLDSTGAIVSTVVTASHGTELSTTKAAHAFTVTPTSTSFSKGDRIRVVAFVDDNATTGNMGSGYTFTLNFDGDAANTANTYLLFIENMSFLTSPPDYTLSASDKATGDEFGHSIACSSDGSVLVVGAKGDDSFTGSVYVYSGTNYGTEKKLVASDAASGASFGYSVACSSDGSVVVVGSPGAAPGGVSSAGTVYVYSGTNYATEKKLVASDKADSDGLGFSVACSSDGSVIAVGARDASPGGTSVAGAAYVYSGTNYSTEKKLVASDKAAFNYLGGSIACSSSGSVVVVGAAGGTYGAVYVYSGTNYATETKLVASDKASADAFGSSVACSSDGSVAVAGSPGADPGGTSNAGAVYVYSGTNYATEKKLVGSNKTSNGSMGKSVACSSDGKIIVTSKFNQGPYHYSDYELILPDFTGGAGYTSITCSSDGAILFKGNSGATVAGSDTGAVNRYVVKPYYLTATASDIADQGTDEKKVWTSR